MMLVVNAMLVLVVVLNSRYDVPGGGDGCVGGVRYHVSTVMARVVVFLMWW